MLSSHAARSASTTRGSLLIVDDERSLLDAVSRYLSREGFEVRTATTAGQALEALATSPAEVMLCDVGLPDMDATLLVTAARRAVPGMLVLMFSGRHDQDIADELFEAGASAYVTKPLPLRALRDVVDQAMRERREQ